MSVIIVSDEHISAMLRFGFGDGWADKDFRDQLQTTANILREENTDSYNERYHQEHAEFVPCVIDYTQPELSPVQVLKLLQCYEGNSDQLGTYHCSRAAQEVRRIREKAIRRLAGYDAARWEI